jgi:flagellar M-ring protein FliF
MNWDQTEQMNETYAPGDPSQAPVRSSHDITETSTGGASLVGGVPGAATNNGAVPTYQGGTNGGSSTTKTDKETTYELNKTVQKVVRAPGGVTRLSVAVMLDDDPNTPNPSLRKSVQDAVNAAAGIDTSRGDVLTVTSLAFNREELFTTQAAMTEAAQKEQVMSYARLAALGVGPLLMVVVLFFILTRGRKKHSRDTGAGGAAAADKQFEIPAANPPVRAPRSARANAGVAQPIVEDPQKLYIREQIQTLGKSNPATVAQLIQTWMDEDRRN